MWNNKVNVNLSSALSSLDGKAFRSCLRNENTSYEFSNYSDCQDVSSYPCFRKKIGFINMQVENKDLFSNQILIQ